MAVQASGSGVGDRLLEEGGGEDEDMYHFFVRGVCVYLLVILICALRIGGFYERVGLFARFLTTCVPLATIFDRILNLIMTSSRLAVFSAFARLSLLIHRDVCVLSVLFQHAVNNSFFHHTHLLLLQVV